MRLSLVLILSLFSYFTYAQIHVDLQASGVHDGTSWENAYSELATALASSVEGDILWIATGAYTVPEGSDGFLIDKKIDIYGSFAGTESSLEERDLSSDNITFLSGDRLGNDIEDDLEINKEDNACHVLDIRTDDRLVYINGLVIISGYCSGEADLGNDNIAGAGALTQGRVTFETCLFTDNRAEYGGAVFVKSSDHLTTFKECLFANNLAQVWGGGVFADDGKVTLNISESFFLQNQASSGGGLMLGGAESTLNMESSIFSDNVAFRGGGVQIDLDAEATIHNCDFLDNQATYGGGLRTILDATITVTDSYFEGNKAIIQFEENDDPRGGAIDINTGGNVHIINCEFLLNESEFAGGAMEISIDGIATIDNSTFDSNSASEGAGAILANGGSVLNSTNNVYTGNNSDPDISQGGAILLFDSDMVSENDDFTRNSASDGGAINLRFGTLNILEGNFSENVAEFAGAISITGFPSSIVKLTVDKSHFSGNEATYGGAIYVFDGAESDIINSTFEDNFATTNAGAIIYDRGGITHSAGNMFTGNVSIFAGGANQIFNTEVTSENDTYNNNQSVNGGALTLNGGGTLNMTGGSFIGNEATYGGALEVDGAIVNISHSAFEMNVANDFGGAMCVWRGSNLNMNQSLIMNNSAVNVGGGVSIDNGADETTEALKHLLTNNIFQNNNAPISSGINFYEGSGTFLNNEIINTLHPNNGPLFQYVDVPGLVINELYFLHNTFVDLQNSTLIELGDVGFDNESTVVVENNIFYSAGDALIASGAGDLFISNGGNLSFSDQSEHLNSLNDVNGVDPLFTDIDNFDFTLTDDSPAINIAVVPEEAAIDASKDISGIDRGEHPDIGANENPNGNSGCMFPMEIGASVQGPTRFIMSWNQVENATGYMVRVRFKGRKRFMQRKVRRNKAIGAGPRNQTYEYSVASICEDGSTSTYSQWYEITLPPSEKNNDDPVTEEIVIYDYYDNSLTAFPNPASNYVTVDYRVERPATLSIHSMTGQRLKSIDLEYNSSQHRIDVSELVAGTYTMIIHSGGIENRHHKLVKM